MFAGTRVFDQNTFASFQGTQFRLANAWEKYIDIDEYKDRPINYLEIGAFHGANAISVAYSYALHPESKLHLIDPWEDYSEYPEYKGEQEENYRKFVHNIEISGVKDKISVHRGYSKDCVPTLRDEYFDLIYIDGNHEPEAVLEDAVLCFRKLKRGGILIFDDYGWGGPDLTQRGIDAFVSGYYKQIASSIRSDSQFFVLKR
jgi:predicted O-methyltransferase YrrM